MKFDNHLTDAAVLLELGARIKHKRLDADLTQAQLAQAAGVAKRTLERLESGDGTDSLALVRVFRALKLLDQLENVLPDTRQSPMTLLQRQGRERLRVRARRAAAEQGDVPSAATQWKWGR